MTTDTSSLIKYNQKVVANRLGLWLFILSDAFLFGGLFVARFYLLGTQIRPEVDQLMGLGVTSVLLLSSFFMNRAEIAASYGDQKQFLNNTLVTIILGTLFLVGVVGLEWQLSPHGPDFNATYALFYTMTGFHAFHVLTGVIFLVIIYRNGRKGLYNAERHWPVEAAAVYWHFIDVVWVFFYPALYLIGLPA
ncbi:MAG TPA: cytochrome c oxidase subunit 3 [Anaerolineales bacterium]|nr:cytochrome c oxidase subunit 3 [Anaerolineales bacterium]